MTIINDYFYYLLNDMLTAMLMMLTLIADWFWFFNIFCLYISMTKMQSHFILYKITIYFTSNCKILSQVNKKKEVEFIICKFL